MQKKNTKKSLSLFLALSVVATMLPVMYSTPIVATAAANDATVAVDWSKEYQTMDGFGAAEAFNKAAPFYDPQYAVLSDSQSSQLMDFAWSTQNGIGLNIFRMNIGDGSSYGNKWYDGAHETILPAANQYVWDQPDWDTKKDTFDHASIKMTQEAIARGAKVYADAWTAPTWMATGQGGVTNSLKTENYQAYADYLINYCIGYKKWFNIPVTYLGPTNEESPVTGNNYLIFVRDYLRPTLNAAAAAGKFAAVGAPVPLLVGPEGMNYGLAYGTGSGSASGGANAIPGLLDVFSTHLYGSEPGTFTPGPKTAGASDYPTFLNNYTHLWQSEYMDRSNYQYPSDATMAYSSETITDGLKWTNLMTNMITSNPGFTAYLWWWALGNNGADGSDLVHLCTSGSPQSSSTTLGTATGEYRTFKRFYTFGQFSRYIDPGDVRIDATRVPATGTNVVAFKDKTNNELKLVFTNSSANDQNVTFNVSNLPGEFSATSMVPFRTSASENEIKLAPVAITNGSFNTVIPANTVVTLVSSNSDKAALNGLSANRDCFSTLETEANDGATTGVTYTGTGATLGDKDYVKFANINFADGSANGGIVRRHVMDMILKGYATEDALVDVHVDSPDGKIITSFRMPKSADTTSKNYDSQLNTGDLYAYGHRDIYVTVRTAGKVFIDVFSFNQNIVAGNKLWTDSTSTGNLLSMGGFDTGTASQITSVWSAFGGSVTMGSSTAQTYSAPAQNMQSTSCYSLMISKRSAANSGVAETVTSKLVNGETYSVNGQFLPTQAGTTGTIALAYTDLGGNAVVAPVASRSNMTMLRWNQITGTFKWDTTNVDTTKPVTLALYDNTANDLYVDEISLSSQADLSNLFTALNTKIKSSRYSSAVLQSISDKLAAGWDLVVNASAKQADVDATAASLNTLYATKLPTDASALTQIVAKANGLTAASYTADSWAALQQAVASATTVLGSDPTQSELDDAFYAVADGIDSLVYAPNKTGLKTAIDIAGGIKLANYTQDSADKVTAALNYAVSVNTDPNATQAQINTAYNNLMDAVLDLALNQPDPSLLNAIANAQKKDKSKITAASWAVLDTALHNALMVVEDPASTPVQIATAKDALMSAMKGLVYKADTSSLANTVAEAVTVDTSKYLADDIAAFQTALANAQAVLANDESTQDQVTAADNALTTAHAALKLKADKAAIDALVAQINAVDASKYTPESISAIKALLAKVQAKDYEISKTDLEAFQAEFTTAKTNLVLLTPTDTGTGSTGNTGNTGSNGGSTTTTTTTPTNNGTTTTTTSASNPKTGDNGVELSVMLLALCSAAVLFVRRRKTAKK